MAATSPLPWPLGYRVHRQGLMIVVTKRSWSQICDWHSRVVARFHLKLESEHCRCQEPPTSLPLPPTSREDLRLKDCLEYPHAAKALYIYKHPYLLRNSNPGLKAEQSASLTTMPDGL
ncbi:uncharacterized protein TNCV_4082431 [Trichonephila clavipes]|nr:uncharacterized protein TNCV_4082431 [Trichonephila clavipes]